MSKAKTDVVEANTSVLTTEERDLQLTLAENSGSGFEEADMTSFAVPFISILQALSPQCKKKEPEYIEGAEEGMFMNSVTGEIMAGEPGIEVIPVYFTQRYIAWGLREKGGGFKGEYKPTDPIVGKTTRDEKGRDIIDAQPDVQLVDTRTHYVLLKTSDDWTPAVLSFSSTQVKKSKQWMARMQQIRVQGANGLVEAPMFSRIWTLGSMGESNDQGSWSGYKIGGSVPITDKDLLYRAMTLKEQVQTGLARASYEAPVVSAAEKEEF